MAKFFRVKVSMDVVDDSWQFFDPSPADFAILSIQDYLFAKQFYFDVCETFPLGTRVGLFNDAGVAIFSTTLNDDEVYDDEPRTTEDGVVPAGSAN